MNTYDRYEISIIEGAHTHTHIYITAHMYAIPTDHKINHADIYIRIHTNACITFIIRGYKRAIIMHYILSFHASYTCINRIIRYIFAHHHTMAQLKIELRNVITIVFVACVGETTQSEWF